MLETLLILENLQFNEMFVLGFFLVNGVFAASSQPNGVGNPENITVQVIDSKTVEVFWSTSWKNVERYDITYNPTENRVVSQAAGNSHSIILRELRPNTQYQVTVTAVIGGKNYKSRRLVFRTSADPNENLDLEHKFSPTKPTKSKKWHPQSPEPVNPDPTAVGSKNTPPTSTTVRGVEIGLVLLALCVWLIAIALFFHRWGKIRMLLPYQPDYKTQQSLKVPGTGTTIVTGCTGNSNSQGQQEGPGCVQHLRWSSRYSDEASAAKKCSPARRQLRPRVSSAVFPSSPSYFYARTSAESDSPRKIRHAHSHNDFQTESIPLCQVNQPRSDSTRNIISITVPVIASKVNEKTQSKKTGDSQKYLNDDAITEFGDEFFKSDKLDNCLCSLGSDDSYKSSFRYFQSASQRRRRRRSLEEREISEWENENEHKLSGSKAQLCTDFVNLSPSKPPPPPPQEYKLQQPAEKPKRYSRSSLKKQTVRLYEDPDCSARPPIYESECNSHDKSDIANPRKSKNPKSAEMKRKAFLRKISLQDTYVNYNQDYWLDYKKSLRFHKSIDLGYIETEKKARVEAESKRTAEEMQVESDCRAQTAESDRVQSSAIMRQSKLPFKFTPGGSLKKSDSDPVIFPTFCSCADCRVGVDTSNGVLMDLVTKNDRKEISCRKTFFLPPNEDIPLFLDRNGLIETDFNILDEECHGDGSAMEETESLESEARDFGVAIDFSNFYEIKLNSCGECESEKTKKSNAFDFGEPEPFFQALPSTSRESDVFYNETDPLMVSEGSRRPELPNFCSSSSPPKSTPD